MRPFILLLFLLSLLPTALQGQSKSALENKRKKLEKEIATTNRLLKNTTKNKAAAYDRFVALQIKIKQRERLISTLTEEITENEENLRLTTGVVSALSEDIKVRKEEYGHILRTSYRFKATSNPLLFVLSAKSLNQVFRRLVFLRQYHKYRKQQAEAIAFTRRILAQKLMNLETDKGKKQQLIVLQSGQKQTLTVEMKDKDQLVSSLKNDEIKLKTDLEKKEIAFIALNKEIERIIQAEVKKQIELEAIRKAEEVARKKEEASSVFSKPRSSPSSAEISSNAYEESAQSFMRNRGKLPLPVESGFITRSFGMNPHPTITSIKIPNNGIDIRTDEYAMAYSVFEGNVVGVTFVPGHDYTVILQHGKYFTVYSNLQEVTVKKGDHVTPKFGLGRVSMNPVSGTTELHFEIWLNKERLNPSLWLIR